ASVEIGGDDAEALHKEGRLFLDARRSSVYAEGHIPGARSFPVWESDIDGRVKAFFDEGLDQNAPIVIYCSGGDCEDSHMLAEKLYMVGFNALYIYKDGFPGWSKRGLPANKGANP
ncbi:MAG TPA: rhodanese-like domain-containing protein, partial [Thermoanaerobaculia bacterium]|nr:rhodanese-like domain-containing protein [Thermoanaerobaculia bacterium]